MDQGREKTAPCKKKHPKKKKKGVKGVNETGGCTIPVSLWRKGLQSRGNKSSEKGLKESS